MSLHDSQTSNPNLNDLGAIVEDESEHHLENLSNAANNLEIKAEGIPDEFFLEEESNPEEAKLNWEDIIDIAMEQVSLQLEEHDLQPS
ncbi:hypothetical protein PCASD_15932 [Puccinia coronata f. sp. avenae]|uniref:Uncharacterized protein n=1 Tax=Puccinia coronata f. sp. avenae TaxID=200324 RepID=A0A2N5UEY9_9BASI|nr:hypothetical protein PCASD_15932 [Puccinia coronata f. sp. avenae]